MNSNIKNKKKAMVTLMIGALVLLVLIFSATYAYFNVGTSDNFGTTSIKAGAAQVGNVALTSGSNLTLNLTRDQMMQKSSDTSYYASANGTTTTETSPIMATATVTGEGTYSCNYTLTIAKSATNDLYNSFQSWSGKTDNQIVLKIGDQVYDFNTPNMFDSNNRLTYSGTFNGITSSTAVSLRSLTAQLKFVNKNALVQDALQGKDITLTFTASEFNCMVINSDDVYTVTFDANGGSVSPSTKSVTYNGIYGELPIPTKSGYTFKGWSELPDDYQKLEYIESTGSQYINTGAQLYNGTNHEIVIDFSPTEFYNYNTIYGSTVDADTFEGWIYSNGSLASRFKSVRYGNDNSLSVDTRYYYTLKKEGTKLSKYVNGALIGTGTVTSSLTDSQKASNFLLLLSGSDYGKDKIYGSKLYRDEVLLRDFIPCYKISTNKAGLYDIKNNVFYPNAATTGDDFTRGLSVNVISSTIVTQSNNHTLTAIWEAN